MRLCRFGESRLGLVEGSAVRDVTAALDVLPAYHYPLPTYDVLIGNLDKVVERIGVIAPSSVLLPIESIKLLSPIANPGKIIAAPLNYRKHEQEVRNDPALHNNNPALKQSIDTMGLFLKATSSLSGAGEGIALRKLDRFGH
jgi:2,4-didehydro-3-deoxy-L-rhamnonate hydrolase